MLPESGRRRAALSFIFVTVLLDMLAMGIVMPVLPRLVFDFLGGDTAGAARTTGLVITLWALMQFLFSPLLGLLSDRFGRRPVVLLSNLGLGLDYVVMALAPTVGWLIVGRLLSGITAASVPVASAYISDVTPSEKRAGAFGMLGAAFGVGFVLGPALGGWLGMTNPRLPFWFAGALSLLNALYGFLVLPESLPADRRAPRLRWRSANPLGSLSLLRSHPELLGLATVNFLGYLAQQVYSTVFVLYVMYRYHWNQRAVGTSLALVGVCTILISGGVVRPLVARLGERYTLYAGLLLGTVGLFLLGSSRTGGRLLSAIPIACLWALVGPASQAMMTRRVSPAVQGELQGALASVRSVAMVIGPILFPLTFAAFIAPERPTPLPGAPWYLASALMASAMAVALAVAPRTAVGARRDAEVAEAPPARRLNAEG
jgi:MFS transporter, DHA1 family, tetracycline resistance protein